MFNNEIGQSERANRLATQNMKSQITQLAQSYVKQGYSMQQAMRKATSEISRQAPDSGSKWINAFGRIKQSGIDTFSGIHSKIQSFSSSTLGMITKLTAGFVSIKTAMAGLKTGFKTGMEFQDSRMTLDALYGDKKKGGEKFKMATDYANKTPWEESETVGSLVKMKAYGLDDSENMMTMMSDLGATFKSMGQNMDTATEAYSDMMNGEWDRMTSFGMKRETLDKFAKDKGMKSFDNKQGQITDKTALANTFKAYMADKNYTGMTDKLGQTASGKLSTMTGNLKKSLAELVGITENGGVRDGSLFDKFIKGMDTFITKMNSFTESANFDKISNALGDIGGAISSGFSYLMDHPEVASGLLKIGVGLFALNVISSLLSPITSLITLIPTLISLAPILIPIVGAIALTVMHFKALGSILSPDGMFHKGISWLLGKIPFIGTTLQECFESGTGIIQNFFTDTWDWIKSKFGFGTEDKSTTNNNDGQWYGGADGKQKVDAPSNLKYKTASDLLKDGTITKTDASKTVTNKTDVSIHVDKVEKTADIDEFMDTVTKRLYKHAQTRNNLE